MSEAEQTASQSPDSVPVTTTAPAPEPVPPVVTTSDDLSGGSIPPPPAPPPLDQQADPAAPPQAPSDIPPAPPEAKTVEQRVDALEKAAAELTASTEALSDAWMHFAQAGERVLAECRALAQGSENSNVIDIDRRLRVVEASRM